LIFSFFMDGGSIGSGGMASLIPIAPSRAARRSIETDTET